MNMIDTLERLARAIDVATVAAEADDRPVLAHMTHDELRLLLEAARAEPGEEVAESALATEVGCPPSAA